MGTPLRVLLVGDSDDDAQLLLRELERRGYEPAWSRVDTAEAMNASLDQETWDVVLADYSLPRFSGLAALTLLDERGLDVPFIIVSDPVGEEAAVTALRAGAGDYILKDNLTRLAAAVERELREAGARRARKQAEETIRLQGEIVQNMAEGVQLVRPSDGVIVYVNPEVEPMFGYDPGELVGKPFSLLLAPGERSPEETADDVMQSLKDQGVWRGEVRNIGKNGATFWCRLNISTFEHPEYGQVWVCVAENVTERKQAEEALSQSAGQWQDTFDAMQDLVAIIDKDYRILRANEALRQAFPGERVLGAHCYKLLHGTEARPPNCPASQAFSTGQPTHAELREEHLGDCWLDVFAYPIKDEEGAVRRVVHVARDITEQKRSEEALREREERLRGIFEAAKDVSFIITDLAGTDARITEFSPGAEHVFGYQRQEVIGKPLAILHLPEDVANFPATIQALREGKSGLTAETVLVRKSGETFPALLTLYPLVYENGGLNAVLGVTIDITDRKRAEEELRKLNEELERRVAERTAALAAVNEELQAFAYSVSHDLRAPLRSMNGFSQVLLEDYGDELDEQGKDHLQRVRAACSTMGQLIDDLLKLSRITRAEMKWETVNLSDLAQQTVRALRQGEPERQVECVVQDGVTANGDPNLLRIVLENLLGNAWKFTGKQASGKIEFGTAEYEGELAYFVRDGGVGFDMAYASNLFGAFQRLHSTADFAGTGIGLATVQRIVHRHGGRVWAEGAVEKGATFYFTL